MVDPALTVSGGCPGKVVVEGSGVTPRGRVELWGGLTAGSFSIPDGPCVGRELGIADARLLLGTQADSEGGGIAMRSVREKRCGWNLQLLDLTSCAVSEVMPLP